MKDGLRVYTGGTFDLPHRGHLDLLTWCREVAGEEGEVVVSLNGDDFVERYKGHRPVIPYDDRKAILEAFTSRVDRVVENVGGEDSKQSIMEVDPDVIVVGSDWLDKDYMGQMSFTREWLEEQNIALCYIPRHRKVSSTEIKNEVKKE